MNEFGTLFEKSLALIVEKNYATKYLLKKTLDIDDYLAESILLRLENENYISIPDGLLRRTVEKKAFDYVKNKSQHTKSQQSENRRETKRKPVSVKKSAYDILGVETGTSWNEIEKAYKTMAKMYHPDKVAGLAPEYMEIAEQRMKEINVAFQELKRQFI